MSALFVLAILATLPIFAQNAPQTQQTQEKEGALQVFEVALPDISSLHLLRKDFFVARQGQLGWTQTKEDGDVQLFSSEMFSKDGSSGEAIAKALYPLDNTKPCVVVFTNDNGILTYAFILENGKAITTKNRMIKYAEILDQKSGITGVRIFLYSADDPYRKILAERKFMIAK